MKGLTLYIVLFGILSLAGCQSTNSASKNEAIEISQKSSQFSEEYDLLDKLESAVRQGKEDNLSYFAPVTFKTVMDEFVNAKEEYTDIVENGPSSFNVFKSAEEQIEQAKKEIMSSIVVANKSLQLAYKNKETTQKLLADILTQKDMLKTIGSPDVFAKNYIDINERINNLIEYIDVGKVDKAQDKQPELLADMLDLEVRTVRKNFLGQLDADIALIKDKDLAVDTPMSLQKLLEARNNANAIISSTPRATDNIKAAVELANFQLAHLYHLAKEVKSLKTVEENGHEQYLLDKEALLHTISQALGMEDVRDLNVIKQVESIALQAGTQHDKLETANSAVVALQTDSTASSEATQSLRDEFKSQIVNLNGKYDALVIENSQLNKQIQDRDIELSRLKAEKTAFEQAEKKRVAALALAKEEQAKQKVLAEKEKAKKQAELKILAEKEKAKIEAETKALAEQEKLAQNVESANEAAEQVISAEEIKPIKDNVGSINNVEVIEEATLPEVTN